MDLVPKNFWSNLTVVIPGMVTYGTWRFVIFITKCKVINFEVIDKSLILSLCILFAVALLQQAIGITIEAIIVWVVNKNKKDIKDPVYLLFVKRFFYLGTEEFNDNVLRTIGQFFLSLNIAVGQILILIFVFFACDKTKNGFVDIFLLHLIFIIIVIITIFVAYFRCRNAMDAIKGNEEKINEEKIKARNDPK